MELCVAGFDPGHGGGLLHPDLSCKGPQALINRERITYKPTSCKEQFSNDSTHYQT